MKRIFYTVLKKLPLILAVVVAPLTLFLVLHLRPEFLDFLKLPRSEEKTEQQRSLDVDTAADWEKEAALCSTAEDYNELARKAWEAGRGSLSDEFRKRALVLDPENETARTKLGYTRFIPEQSLASFSELLPFFREDELAPYTNLQGHWLTAGETKAFAARWKATSRLLVDRRSRSDALEKGFGEAAWTALNGHALFGKILATWNYRIDRTRPPFVFILEGEEPPGQEPASAFLDTLASDLAHMLATFRSTWLPARAEAGGEDDYGTFHVFVIGAPRAPETHAPRFSKGRARQGAASFLDEATGMLVTSLPEDKILYSGSGANRRAMVQPFGRAIVKKLCHGSMPLWLAEGVSLLLPMGRGVDAAGALRLNGAGTVNSNAFTDWIAEGILDTKQDDPRSRPDAGADDPIPWPLRLETLLACKSAESLRLKCETDRAFANTIEVCALFCHYLSRKRGDDFTKGFATPCLAGQSPSNDLAALLDGLTAQSIERAMVERYISERARSDLIAALRELRGVPQTGPAEKPDAPPAAEQIPYLGEDEILGLVRPGMPAELFRTLVVYLARKKGLCLTERLLRARLNGPGATDGDGNFEGEWRDLQASARFLDAKLGALGAAGFSYRLGEVDVRLKDADDSRLVWEPLNREQDFSTLPEGSRIVRADDRSEATIVTARTALPLEFAVSRFKKLLAPKAEEDRLAYSRLFLFTAEGTRFLNELDSAAGDAAGQDRLRQLLPLYTDALAGAGLITVLAGERSGAACDVIDYFTRQLRKVNKAALLDSLEEKRIGEIVRGLLHRTFTDDDKYIWDSFEGFEGSDGSRARFVYDFTDRAEKEDFEFRPFPLAGVLEEKLGVGTVLAPRSFQVRKERLSAYGSDFVRLKPVFAGEIEIKVSFSFAPKREKNLTKPFYFYFGCTREGGDGYMASACLNGIDLNGRVTGPKAGAPGSLACPSDLAVNKTYAATLSSSAGLVAHNFRGARVSTPDPFANRTDSARCGQVFVWVHGPRWFHIEGIEIDAAIDQAWLDDQIAPSLEEAFEKIMN